MEYAILGKTGLKVSRLGFGAATCGSPIVSEHGVYQMVWDAIENGMNIFDTSPFYGRRESERKLGTALKSVSRYKSRESFIVGTKSGHFDYPDRGDFSYDMTKRSVEHSLELLGTGHLDYLIAHDIEFAANQETIYNGFLRAGKEFRHKGLVRFLGVSGGKVKQLTEAIKSNEFDFVLTYNEFTPLCQNGKELIDLAHDLDVGIINGSPLGFGMFTGRDPRNIVAQYPEHPDCSNLQKAIKLYELAQKYNVSTIQLALRFPMSNPKIATTLIGPASLKELQEDLKLGSTPLPKDVEAEMMKIAYGE